MDYAELSRPVRRLASELKDDGIVIDADDQVRALVLEELEYARRPPQFERRIPLYGAIVIPDDRSLVSAGELVDLVPLDHLPLADARRFADGRSAYLVRQAGTAPRQLACFRRSVQMEADLVEVQADTGAFIVQRTPVMGVTRLFTADTTVEWAGYRWASRPNARAELRLLQPRLADVEPDVLGGLLELAVHWLSPGRTGATLVLPAEDGDADAGLDVGHSIVAPRLSVTERHHYAAILAALMQSDLATVVGRDGRVHRIGVGLYASAEANLAVEDGRGMRHRSAARYTYDQPGSLAIVVSEDGPVTVFRRGKSVTECVGSGNAPLAAVSL